MVLDNPDTQPVLWRGHSDACDILAGGVCSAGIVHTSTAGQLVDLFDLTEAVDVVDHIMILYAIEHGTFHPGASTRYHGI